MTARWDRAGTSPRRASRSANAAAFATILALGHFFAQVLAVAFVEAALGVLFGPAESAAVRRVVPPEQVSRSRRAESEPLCDSGPCRPAPLGGVLLSAARALPFVADASSYLVSLVFVASVRTPLGGGVGEKTTGAADVFAGVRWIWSHRFLRALLLWLLGTGTVFGRLASLPGRAHARATACVARRRRRGRRPLYRGVRGCDEGLARRSDEPRKHNRTNP